MKRTDIPYFLWRDFCSIPVYKTSAGYVAVEPSFFKVEIKPMAFSVPKRELDGDALEVRLSSYYDLKAFTARERSHDYAIAAMMADFDREDAERHAREGLCLMIRFLWRALAAHLDAQYRLMQHRSRRFEDDQS